MRRWLSGFHRPAGRRRPPAKPKTPSEIVAEAPSAPGATSSPDDLLVMDLRNGRGRVIQLAPEFAPVHVANIRALAKGGWWSGAAIYRVQDNYVVQWGNNESTRPLPQGVVAKPPAEYHRALKGLAVRPLGYAENYAPSAGFARAGRSHMMPRRARRTSPIATAMSALAATSRRIPEPAASSTP